MKVKVPMEWLWFNDQLVHEDNGQTQSSLSIIDGSVLSAPLS